MYKIWIWDDQGNTVDEYMGSWLMCCLFLDRYRNKVDDGTYHYSFREWRSS